MFIRKTGVKIAGSILCTLSLAVSLISGFLVLSLLSAGCYDSNSRLFDSYAENLIAYDAHNIMAVSYTHLDVYKRQVIGESLDIPQRILKRRKFL